MIFRKPYAFLIKNFKLIHTIITFCMVYLVYKSYLIFDYIKMFMTTSMLAVNEDVTSQLFNSLMFILPVVIIIGLIILLIVMIKKKKPFIFYILNILIYGASIGVYSYLFDTINYIETEIIAAKDIKLASDICLMLLSAQVISMFLSAIRAFGFDIKKFDFGKDLVELDVSDEDQEEFEVSVNVETNILKRDINKRLRYARYVYIENKLLINSIFLISISAIIYLLYINSTIYNATYKIGDVFRAGSFEIGLNKVYVTQKNYNNIRVTTKDKYLVIAELNVKALEKDLTLNTAKMLIEMNGVDHYPTKVEYRTSIIDLGKTYYKEVLDINFQKILLVYEVREENLKHTLTFKYLNDLEAGYDEYNPKYIKINVKPLFIDIADEQINVDLKETIVLNENNLGDTKFTINSFEIKEEFIVNYNFCVNKECFKSVEYLTAPLNKNYDQALIKINATMEKDSEINFEELYGPFNILDYFGSIEYKIDGKTYITSKGFSKVSPTRIESNNNYYISVNKDILKAEEVNLYLTVRNKIYKYKIK